MRWGPILRAPLLMRRLIALLLLFPLVVSAEGTLLIAGGAVSPDNASVYRAFVAAIPADRKVAIISAASGSPVESARRASATLSRYGVSETHIVHLRLIERDDDSTSIVDESRWDKNGNSESELRKLDDVGAVWITGGDQSRLTRVLLDDGKDTEILQRLRQILSDGGVIGGTSAGAAIMSDPMILFGDTLATLLEDESLGERLEVGQGIGRASAAWLLLSSPCRNRTGWVSESTRTVRCSLPATLCRFSVKASSRLSTAVTPAGRRESPATR